VLLVEYVTFILVFLKTFVTVLVSLLKNVNLDQCVFSVLFLCFLELDTDQCSTPRNIEIKQRKHTGLNSHTSVKRPEPSQRSSETQE